MKKNGLWSIASLIILVAILARSPDIFATQKGDGSSFEKFLAHPSQESWDSLDADIHAGRYGPRTGLFQQVLEYDDARKHRDLPNSMAVVGISLGEHYAQLVERTEKAFGYVRAKESPDLWRLLEKMAVQDFDDELARTAFEIADRLSAARFALMADEVIKLHSERRDLVEMTRWDWESPFQKFLEDPSRVRWQDLEVEIRSGKERLLFRQVLKYHDARRVRDWSGSEGSTGDSGFRGNDGQQKRTPSSARSGRESIEDPASEAEYTFEGIRKEESIYMWQLLGKLAIQDFDDELAWTACEIAARLSEAKFRKIAEEVGRVRPGRIWVIDMIAAKWLNPKNRSKGVQGNG